MVKFYQDIIGSLVVGTNDKIQIFEDKKIRTAWNEETEEWYFSVVDVVGGCKISADWPGLLRRNVEKILDGTKCIFFNGAQGDVTHVNVPPCAATI